MSQTRYMLYQLTGVLGGTTGEVGEGEGGVAEADEPAALDEGLAAAGADELAAFDEGSAPALPSEAADAEGPGAEAELDVPEGSVELDPELLNIRLSFSAAF